MLLLLGGASFMFGSDSVVDLNYWDHTFDDGWFDVTRFSNLSHIRGHTGAYSISVEVYRSSWICMLVPIYGMHAETVTCLLSYHDLSGEPFLSHSVGPTLLTFRCSHASFERHLLIYGLDSTMDLDDWDHTFDDRLFDVVRFSAYSTSDSILGHIFVSIEIYRSSWSYMIIPTCGMHTETRTCLLFYHGPLVKPLLSHPVRPVFFGICMSSCLLFQETFPWRLGSIWVTEIAHLTMDGFMSPNFRRTIHLMPYWGIFSHFGCGDDCFLKDLLQSTLLDRGMFIHIDGHSLNDVYRDELSAEHDLRGLTALLSMTLQ